MVYVLFFFILGLLSILELKLAYTAINEHTNTHNAKYSGIKMVFLSNERRTIIIYRKVNSV